MKKWTKSDDYKWRCEQADLAQGVSKRLDSKKGYYRAEKSKAKPKTDEKSNGVVLIKKYYKSSISTVFERTEKTGTVSDREFFKALYA